MSCDNGTPEESNNLGYRLLENGAIGTVSSSRVSWYILGSWTPGSGSGRGDNASYGYHIFERMVEDSDTVGQALAYCQGSLNLGSSSKFWMNCADFNLYGDPSLSLTSGGVGQTFNVFNDGTINLNVTGITKESGSDWLIVTPPSSFPFTVSPGQSKPVTVTVNADGLSPDTYNDRLLIYSDDLDKSPYPNGVYVSLTVHEPLRPDLVVSEPRPSESPPFYVGQNVNWSVTTTNQGNGAAQATHVGYYLGTNCSDLSNRVDSDSVDALEPDESEDDSDSYTFDTNDVGTRYLIAWADYQNEEPNEESEDNNTSCYGPFEVNPVENSAPVVDNVTAQQQSGTGIVDISYDVDDAEQGTVTISLQYWDGSNWVDATTTTGEGSQSTGTGKTCTWNAKVDFDGHYLATAKIKVIADDGQSTNNIGSGESANFPLDTKNPTGYGCDSPQNNATEVSVNPTLRALVASDDSPPISYKFQLAEDNSFTIGVQESDWQSGDNTWVPPTTLNDDDEYWWKVKVKDAYNNETDYETAFELGVVAPVYR